MKEERTDRYSILVSCTYNICLHTISQKYGPHLLAKDMGKCILFYNIDIAICLIKIILIWKKGKVGVRRQLENHDKSVPLGHFSWASKIPQKKLFQNLGLKAISLSPEWD